MKKRVVFLFCLLLQLVIQNSVAQSISLVENLQVCHSQVNKVPVSVTGQFNSGNQFFFEFFDGVPENNILLGSYPFAIINDSISLNPDASLSFRRVYARIRSTSPQKVFDFGFKTIFGIPSATISHKTTLENTAYNKNQLVEFGFNIKTSFSSDTKVFYTDGTTGSSSSTNGLTRKNFFPYETNNHGIAKITNSCGTNSNPVTAFLQIRPQRVKIQLDEKNAKICPGESFQVSIKSDKALPLSADINFDVKDPLGSSIIIPYTRIEDKFFFKTDTSIAAGTYNINVDIPSLMYVDSRSITVENSATHSISGTYEVKYGEGVYINYNLDTSEDPDYDSYYTALSLNNNQVVVPISNNQVALTDLTESNILTLTAANGQCFQKAQGTAQINVRTTVFIDSTSKTDICNGESIDFIVSSNGDLPFSNDYQLQVGTNYSAGISTSFGGSEFDPIPLTWINDSTFRLTPSNYASLNKSNSYHVAIRNSSLNILGKITSKKITIRDLPNPSFPSTTINETKGNTKVYFNENFYPDGKVLMSDGNTYDMFHFGNNSGYIEFKSVTSASNIFPVEAMNECGTNNSVGGAFNINASSTHNIYFLPENDGEKCVGDSLKFEFSSEGSWNNSNQFKLQFVNYITGSIIDEIIVSQSQKSVIIPSLLPQELYYKVRIVATSPSVSSVSFQIAINPPISNASVSVSKIYLGNYTLAEDPESIEVSPKTQVLFMLGDSHFTRYFTTNGTELKSFERFTVNSDSVITVSYAVSGCDTAWLNQTFNFISKPYLFYPQYVNTTCDGAKTFIEVKYWVDGERPANASSEVWVQDFIGGNPVKATTINTSDSSILVSIGFPEITTQGNYSVKLVDPTYNIEKQFNTGGLMFNVGQRITSTLGNNITLDSIPAKITVSIEGSPYVFGNLNEPLFPLGFEMDITQDTLLFAYYLENECGFFEPKDSIRVNVIPHPTYITSTVTPCLGTEDSLTIFYERTIENFEDDVNLKFYLWNGTSKIPLPNGRHRNKGYITALPTDILEGDYRIGFSRENPSIDRLFSTYNEVISLSSRPYARVLPGTIYQYDDLAEYSIPVFTAGGNGSYGIVTNASELMETFEDPFFPTFGYFPEIINQKGYSVINQTPLFITGLDSLKITELRTSFSGCLGEYSGGINIEYLDGDTHKLFAKKTLETSSIELMCEGGESLNIQLESQGTFNSGNIFTPQLSDHNGLNFTDLPFSQAGNIFNITIPSSLPSGEGYRVRFRSSSPVHFGATSDFLIIIKDKPKVHLSGSNSIVDGEAVDLDIQMTGEPPFNISLNDASSLINIPTSNTILSRTPTETFNYQINSIEDKYCSSTGTGAFLVNVFCKPFLDLGGSFSGIDTFKAVSIDSNAKVEIGAKVNMNAGDTIILSPGFESKTGSLFSTEIGVCPD